MSKKVACYVRVSTSNMGQDVDRQLHEVREFCKRMDYQIVEEYVDEQHAVAGYAAPLASLPPKEQRARDKFNAKTFGRIKYK